MAITSFSGTLPMLTTNSNSILVLFMIWLLLNVFTSDISPFFIFIFFIFQIHSLKRVRIGGFRLPSDLGWLSLTFFCFWEHSLSSSLSSFSLESKFSFCKSGRKKLKHLIHHEIDVLGQMVGARPKFTLVPLGKGLSVVACSCWWSVHFLKEAAFRWRCYIF